MFTDEDEAHGVGLRLELVQGGDRRSVSALLTASNRPRRPIAAVMDGQHTRRRGAYVRVSDSASRAGLIWQRGQSTPRSLAVSAVHQNHTGFFFSLMLNQGGGTLMPWYSCKSRPDWAGLRLHRPQRPAMVTTRFYHCVGFLSFESRDSGFRVLVRESDRISG